MNNVEITVIAWLKSILGDAIPVFGDKPKNIPDTYVLMDRTGGPRIAMVLDAAQLLIEVYAKDSRVTASNTAQSIAAQIPDLRTYHSDITHASVNSIIKLDDTIGQYFRYQVYCDISMRV